MNVELKLPYLSSVLSFQNKESSYAYKTEKQYIE